MSVPEQLTIEDQLLDKLYLEAVEAADQGDKEKFFLLEKKIMLVLVAYNVRYKVEMSKKKKKSDINMMHDVNLGLLSTIQKLDKYWLEVNPPGEEGDQ